MDGRADWTLGRNRCTNIKAVKFAWTLGRSLRGVDCELDWVGSHFTHPWLSGFRLLEPWYHLIGRVEWLIARISKGSGARLHNELEIG